MKKIISILLCILLLPAVQAMEVTLPQKMEVQLDSGSGFRADYSLYVGASDEEEKKLLSGEYTYINDGVTEEYALYDADGGLLIKSNQSLDGLFLYLNAEVLHIVDDGKRINQQLLSVLSKYVHLPATLQTVFSVLGYRHEYQMETPLLAKERRDQVAALLESGLEQYKSDIDLWLQNYLTSKNNSVLNDGSQALGMEFVVPLADVKSYLKNLIYTISQDAFLVEALQESMPYDLSSLLLFFSEQSFIDMAVDALPLAGDISLGRTFSLKGKPISTYVKLPFFDAKGGSFDFEYATDTDALTGKEVQKFQLRNEEFNLSIDFSAVSKGDATEYTGTLQIKNQDAAQSHALEFTVNKKESVYVDSEGKNNQDFSLTADIHNDRAFLESNADYSAIDELKINFSQKFNSGVAKNTSTRVQTELSIANTDKKQSFELTVNGKTSAPWPVEKLLIDEVSLLDYSLEKDYQSAMEKLIAVLLSKAPHVQRSTFYAFVIEALGVTSANSIPILEEDSTAEATGSDAPSAEDSEIPQTSETVQETKAP